MSPPLPDLAPRLGRRLAFALASLAMALLAAEGLLRLVGLATPRPSTWPGQHASRGSATFAADEHTGWRMQPGSRFSWQIEGRPETYVSDERGFRCAEEPRAPRSELAIVVTGDSFTFGTGVSFEETWGALVAEGLGGAALENLAMPGYGVDQMALSVRAYGLDPRPDVVIVGLYPEDFDRSLEAYRVREGFEKPAFKLVSGTLVPRTPADRPGALVRFLEARSYVYTLGRLLGRELGQRCAIGESWRLNGAVLEALIADCRAAGAPLLFVHIPPRSWRPFPALARWMEEHGASLLDLARESPQPQGLYFERDGHLNAAGHRYVAARVLAFLAERGMVPAGERR